MEQIKSILKKYWGHTTFRPFQKEIIHALLEKKDVLAILPTGAGKSLTFQLPGLISKGCTLIISPLIALMEDQVQKLNAKGIGAAALHGGIAQSSSDYIINEIKKGKITYLYLSPERATAQYFQEQLKNLPITLLVVDEAHCLSTWGESFRSKYLQLHTLRHYFPKAPMAAFTATAPPEMAQKIIDLLSLKRPVRIQSAAIPKNLSLVLRKYPQPEEKILSLLKKVKGSIIIYTGQRIQAEKIAYFLNKKGESATHYHGAMEVKKKMENQKKWDLEKARIMVATNAFGMGIDKKSVRLVLHLGLPRSLEDYIQEAGRAGRDGKPSYALLLLSNNYKEKSPIEDFFLSSDQLKTLYQWMSNYFQMAIGSDNPEWRPFDPQDFLKRYRLPYKKLMRGLNQLMQRGLIAYEEGGRSQAKIAWKSTAQALYHAQSHDPLYGKIIKNLKRHLPPPVYLPSPFYPISLNYLSKSTQASAIEIHKALKKMAKEGFIAYQPAHKLPRLRFATPRYNANLLPIEASKIQKKQEEARKKRGQIIAYIELKKGCRAAWLARHLGEKNPRPCSICDLCRKKP